MSTPNKTVKSSGRPARALAILALILIGLLATALLQGATSVRLGLDLIRYLLDGVLPENYAAQVHFSMFVTGRPKWTFLSYHRSFPAFVIEVQRQERIEETFRAALDIFAKNFAVEMEKLKSKG